MKRRILLLTGVVVIAAATIGSLGWRSGRIHGFWYRWKKSETAFYQAMYRGIKNGDTREKLEAFVGKGRDLDAKGQARYAKIMAQWAIEKRSDAPDGYQPGDLFVSFKTGGYYQVFQLRNGRLVNFDPAIYADMKPFAALGQ